MTPASPLPTPPTPTPNQPTRAPRPTLQGLLRPGVALVRGDALPADRSFPGGWGLTATPPDADLPAARGVLRRSGAITADERWSGVVHLVGDVVIPPGVTVEVMPGTLILLAHFRRWDERRFRFDEPYDEPASLDVRGGRLRVHGSGEAPVWLTSDAPDPRPGDWRYLQLRDACPSAESALDGVIVEFAKLGVLCWNAAPRLRGVLVRQCAWEGIYAENHAAPRVAGAISRDNGYNGVALEQFNDAWLRDCVLSGNGTHGLHVDSSRCRLERSLVRDNGTHGVSADNGSRVRMRACQVMDNALHGVGLDAGAPSVEVSGSRIGGNGSAGINCRERTDLVARDNHVSGNRPIELHVHAPMGDVDIDRNWWGSAARPDLERDLTGEGQPGTCAAFFWPDWGTPLEGPPPLPDGAPRLTVARALDRAARVSGEPVERPGASVSQQREYVAADDATRRIVRRIGAGLGLPWSVTWDGEALWTATLDTDALVRLDPRTGEELARFRTPGPQAWGLAWDGEALWLNDFAELTVYRVDPATGAVRSSFAIPDRAGGAKGITWTGEHLALLGWRSHALWLLDRDGRVRERVVCPLLKGGLAYDARRRLFWGPCREFVVGVHAEGGSAGQVAAAIHAASDGTWDLEWAGDLLWATQRTNENWDDPKLYALEVVDARRIDLERFRRRLTLYRRLSGAR